jgi:hypothetical protein
MKRSWRYDLDGVNLEDCSKLLLLPVHVGLVPAIMGTLQALTWRARHETDTSWEIGISAYAELQEIFNMNDCIIDSLDGIADNIAALQCICERLAEQTGSNTTIVNETVYQNLEGNADVSFTEEEDPNLGIGAVPPGADPVRCQKSQAVWYNVNDVLDRVVNRQLGVATVSSGALVAFIAALLLIPVPFSIILGLLAGIALVYITEDTRDALASWYALSSEGICAIYNSTDMSGAASAIANLADANISDPTANTMIKLFFGSTLMGQFWSSSNNEASFDGNACVDCQPGEGDCFEFYQCDVGHWDGGTVECVDGEVQIKGGTAFYEIYELDVPSDNSQITLSWIPRAEGYGFAECELALYDVNNETSYFLGKTGLQPVDVQRQDVFVVPAILDTETVYVGIKQWGFWAAPKWVCIIDV